MQNALLEFFEIALNQYIKLDPDYQKSLKPFVEKVILIQMQQPDLSIYLFPHKQGFTIQSQYADDADTTIQSTLSNYMQVLIADDKEKNEAVFQKKITISGDIHLGQKFQEFFRNLDIDWEEHLSHFTGDIIAHQSFSFANKFVSFAEQAKNSLNNSFTEYVKYETRDLIEKREMSELLNNIDSIREDVDRAEAHYQRLRDRMQ